MTKKPKPVKKSVHRLFVAAIALPFKEGFPVVRFLTRQHNALTHEPLFRQWVVKHHDQINAAISLDLLDTFIAHVNKREDEAGGKNVHPALKSDSIPGFGRGKTEMFKEPPTRKGK